jgi:hypothetical protein
MFDPDLIHKINNGRCFALIGSGPSCEVGYPSWAKLTQDVWAEVLREKPTADQKSFDRFIARMEFAAALRQAEVELGSRTALISVVQRVFIPVAQRVAHPIYEYLARWPFACYLTTNYDNEIQKALNGLNVHFQTISNTIQDLALLRDGADHLIVKLHADLTAPERMVLTSLDYSTLISAPDREPFRARLRQIFETFDILLVGHSMSDPDLQHVLAIAKHSASADHPIFMMVANATPGDKREYLEKFNIRLLAYEDTDGYHRGLKGMLSMADRFIAARGDAPAKNISHLKDEIADATSLLIYRRLRTVVSQEPITQALAPLLLKALATSSSPIAFDSIVANPAVAALAKTPDLMAQLRQCLTDLKFQGLVAQKSDSFSITNSGEAAVNNVYSQRKVEEDQAFGQFRLDLEGKLPGLTSGEHDQAVDAFRNCLVSAFRERGISMANVIIGGQASGATELTDLFRQLTAQSRQFKRPEVREAFMEAGRDFLVEPSEPQQRYLASVSQGFFLYHLAGLDPSCGKVRNSLFRETCWFLDSSVLLPLLAKGCSSHDYADDLFTSLKAAKATLFTTPQLLKEVWHHLKWATDFVLGKGIDSPDFLLAAMARENFKQNLFIDGYIRLSADGAVGTFKDYLQLISIAGLSQDALQAWSRDAGVRPVSISDFVGFVGTHWGDVEELKEVLAEQRKKAGTFRGDYQVAAEAEVLAVIRRVRTDEYSIPGGAAKPLRTYFVSQSRSLDRVDTADGAVSWSPEALYRYASALPGAHLKPELLQQCMLSEYFYAGVTFIDKPRYRKFFGPAVNQAKLDYKDQVQKYLDETEQTDRLHDFDEAFDRVPDLEKPFFVGQMGWKLARTIEEKAKQAVEIANAKAAKAESDRMSAEIRAKSAESSAEGDRKKRATAEQEANRQRNLQDPEHLKKRQRQAKERDRKKRR